MHRILSCVGILLFFVMGLSSDAQARHRQQRTGLSPECNVTMPCDIGTYAVDMPTRHPVRRVASRSSRTVIVRHVTRSHEEVVQRVSVYGGDHAQMVDHPSGCPRTAFCGCGAAVRLFGKPMKELWAAASWFRFPRASPAPGMAAVRQHHVMVIEGRLDNGMWLVYDANSGGHRTRIHARSLAGYTIVNPQGGRG